MQLCHNNDHGPAEMQGAWEDTTATLMRQQLVPRAASKTLHTSEDKATALQGGTLKTSRGGYISCVQAVPLPDLSSAEDVLSMAGCPARAGLAS